MSDALRSAPGGSAGTSRSQVPDQQASVSAGTRTRSPLAPLREVGEGARVRGQAPATSTTYHAVDARRRVDLPQAREQRVEQASPSRTRSPRNCWRISRETYIGVV